MTLVNLHFAGSRLYTPDKFEAEAARVGVARALPAFAVRNLAYGDLVLLATFRGRRDENGKAPIDSDGKAVRLGAADAWGYFVVNGLNVEAPAEFHDRLLAALHVIRTVTKDDHLEDEPLGDVERECGSYTIDSVSYVRESIAEIVERGEAIAQELGIKVKWFVTGTVFRPLAPHVSIEDAPFTRTIVKVELEGWTPFVTPPQAKTDGRPLAFIGDYSSRRYRKISDEERAAANRRRIEAANRGRRLGAEAKR